MKKLIGLAGPARVGKSTVAEILCNRFNFEERAYADPLKRSLMELTGLGKDYFYDQDFKHEFHPLIGMSPRMLMQLFGTEFVRNTIRKDFWVERMRWDLKRSYGNQVISDVRFDDEADLIRDLGGTVIILSRDGFAHNAEHLSEAGITKRDGDLPIYMINDVIRAEYQVTEMLRDLKLV